MRQFASGIIVLALGVANAAAQQAPPRSFEVASIKPSGPIDPQKILSGQQRVGMKMDAGRVDIESLGLSELINLAFKVQPYQVTGPSWLGAGGLNAERFDIHATFPSGATTEQVPEMLQSLLVERFKLAFHRDRKEQSVFALVVGKNGPKLQASAPDAPPDASGPAGGSVRPDPVQVSGNAQSGLTIRGAGAAGATRVSMSPDGTMHLESDKLTVTQLADSLTRFVGRPVVDMTGLTGNYKIALDLSREDLMAAARAMGMNLPAGGPGPGGAPGGGPPDPSGTSVFQSVDQLGLKLESRKSAIEQIVIDHLERTPTED